MFVAEKTRQRDGLLCRVLYHQGEIFAIKAKFHGTSRVVVPPLCRTVISRWAANHNRQKSCRPNHHRFDCPSYALSRSFLFRSLWYSICSAAAKCNSRDYTFLPRQASTFLTFCRYRSCLLRLHYYIMRKTVEKQVFL